MLTIGSVFAQANKEKGKQGKEGKVKELREKSSRKAG